MGSVGLELLDGREARQVAEVLAQLLEEEECEDRVWADADEGRHEALEEAERPQLSHVLHDLPLALVLAGLGVHRARLQHVQRLSQRGRDASGDQRGHEVQARVVLEVAGLQQHQLHLLVERNLANRHQEASTGGGRRAGEQTPESLFVVHAN